MDVQNGVMLQAFEWDLPADGEHWARLTAQAFGLHRAGFTALWLPPAYKGASGGFDVGYGVYDLYDLGEFDQKGSVRTKYGTRTAYLRLIRRLHLACIQALPDVVLNHRMGGDEPQQVEVYDEPFEHRNDDTSPKRMATLYSRLTFPGRHGKYSRFMWDASCFTGADWDASAQRGGLYRLVGKHWAEDVDGEHGNYDYLMGLDVDVNQAEVRRELLRWGLWYQRTTQADGFRLDAVKHISAAFYADWLSAMRRKTGRELFSVGEYWHYDVGVLCGYLARVGEQMSLFDVPLHYHLREAGNNRFYNMSQMFEGTLVGRSPQQAVTFVDNHDTQPGQSLESWVPGWFKPAAYGLILLRAFGYPCVFWGDWAGIPAREIGRVPCLPKLLALRQTHARGEEHDYFDHTDVIGFTREGQADRPGSGLAFLCTNAMPGEKRMYVGRQWAGRAFTCVEGSAADVLIDAEGCGAFSVEDSGMNVWIPRPTLKEMLGQAWRKAWKRVADGAHGVWWCLLGHE